MPVSNSTFARQYPGDRRRDYEFPRNKRLFKRFNGENGSRRIAMSALLAGSRCSIRVVSFLIERCDPFYYSALLSSIMRPDTARYPFATREYRPLLSAIDRFPISTSFRRRVPLSSIENSHAMYNRRSTTRTITEFRSSGGNRANSIVTENWEDWVREVSVSKLVLNLTWRIYHRVRGSMSVRKGRWRPAPSDRIYLVRKKCLLLFKSRLWKIIVK